jgi:serine protease
MRLIPREAALAAVIGVLLLAGCKDSATPIPRTPTTLTLVSGSNQTGDLSAALAAPLVVRASDAAGRPVASVEITWAVTGGGSVSPPTATTDSVGEASVTWTLGPSPGSQTATATSAAITGASVAFVASNGPTIMGAVTVSNPDPTSFFSAPLAPAPATTAAGARGATRRSSRAIVVVFRSHVVHVAAAGSPAYQSMDVARATAKVLRTRTEAITRGLPIGETRISPAILAARLTLTDTTKVDSVLTVLRADPSVASASRDLVYTLRDGAPPPRPAGAHARLFGSPHATGAATNLPNDPDLPYQSWGVNMTDLPRAWALTTGSTAFTIAVIDMGVRFDDPAVAPNLTHDGYDFVSDISLSDLGYTSPGQICGGGTFTTISGDGNGPDADPTDPDDLTYDSTQDCWQRASLGDHGEWVAGIIGAVGNDGSTVTGVDWRARIRPIRALGITGDGSTFDIAQAILYAAGLPATGADDTLVTALDKSPIINLSLGGSGSDPAEAAAVAAAVQAGCLVVAAAGNQTSATAEYPAAYPDVVGVSAVGMDGVIASYSNTGTDIDLAAPGGEYRGDNTGGGGVLGPGWNFTTGQPVLMFGYGTSAAAPYVSGIAGLLLASNPSLSATDLSDRLEQYATRAPNTTRSDTYGWGVVNAYDALAQSDGPPRASYVRLIDADSGAILRTVATDPTGAFVLTQLPAGRYELAAGEDESGDGVIGLPGRRFSWDGSASAPTVFTVTTDTPQVQTTAVSIGIPLESEPNDTPAEANPLSVDSYVEGRIDAPDANDDYRVSIPVAGTYTFETSGVLGACGWGLELDTKLDLLTSTGATVASNDDSGSPLGPQCSKITQALLPGTYTVVVSGSAANGLSDHGRYRLQVRTGS